MQLQVDGLIGIVICEMAIRSYQMHNKNERNRREYELHPLENELSHERCASSRIISYVYVKLEHTDDDEWQTIE